MSDPLRVVVIGAGGNAGSAVLRSRGRHRVSAVSRRVPDRPPVPWQSIDISDPSSVPALTRAFAGADAVVHLAWLIQPGRDEPTMRRTNVQGTRNVTRAVVAAGVPHLVVASSVGAYSPGPKHTPVAESWPTGGVVTSAYSRHKVEVERLLDDLEATEPGLLVSRLRPGLIFQSGAAAEIARYFLGPLVPTGVLGHLRLPAVPLPDRLRFQAVHADDVAAAFWTVIERRAAGAFNVATDPLLTPDDLARALGARRAIGLPLPVLRAIVDLSWRAHVQPTDPGWIDLAASVPLMSTERLRALGWKPVVESRSALIELVDGLRRGSGDDVYPALARRSVQPGQRAVRPSSWSRGGTDQ